MKSDPRICRRKDGMGKVGYTSKRFAKRALRRITGPHVAVGLPKVYRCANCTLWHLGRKSA